MKEIKSIGLLPGPKQVMDIGFYLGEIRRIFRELKADVSIELTNQPPSFDLIMVLGGDGMLSGAAKRFAPLGIPLIGVNFGEVGFLCAIEGLGDRPAFQKLVTRDYILEDRMMIRGRVFRPEHSNSASNEPIVSRLAFAEITVKSAENNKMVTIGYSIDGGEEEEIRSDGMMVATPTGSTGYSLSCAGPIVMPSVESLIINAIAPHTLHFRPIIAEKDSVIILRLLRTKGEGASFWVDMQESFPLQINDIVEITKSDVQARLVSFSKDSFFRAVKNKLK